MPLGPKCGPIPRKEVGFKDPAPTWETTQPVGDSTLSIRDLFAMAAMHALLSRGATGDIAKQAVKHADDLTLALGFKEDTQ